MKKFLLRAAVLAIFTAGITTTVGIVGAGTAMARPDVTTRSDKLAATLPQVNHGDRGPNVLALQLALQNRGYKLQGTGNYANLTLNAVRDFQRKHGIKASGIVGSKTWHALVGSLSPYSTGNGNAVPPSYGITPGEKNESKVSELHNALGRIYPYTHNSYEVFSAENDTYGPRTQKIVKDFQRRAGIKASGIVGPKTWAAMYKANAVAGHWGC